MASSDGRTVTWPSHLYPACLIFTAVCFVAFLSLFAQPATPAAADPPPEGAEAPQVPPPKEGRFLWPTVGPITSFFGPAHPLGIDLGLAQYPNADIRAADRGKVVYAGGPECCSYGLHVMIDHGDDLLTVYAHLSRIDVAEGQEVIRGQRLGLGGTTGRSTSEHLHFELRFLDTWLDPLLYLPATQPAKLPASLLPLGQWLLPKTPATPKELRAGY